MFKLTKAGVSGRLSLTWTGGRGGGGEGGGEEEGVEEEGEEGGGGEGKIEGDRKLGMWVGLWTIAQLILWKLLLPWEWCQPFIFYLQLIFVQYEVINLMLATSIK